MIQSTIDQFNTDEERQAAEDALPEETGRQYAVTWAAYKEARARLMRSVVYELGSVAAADQVAHRDLTAGEREQIVKERKKSAQSAWADFQSAERLYVLAVDDNMPVEFRQP